MKKTHSPQKLRNSSSSLTGKLSIYPSSSILPLLPGAQILKLLRTYHTCSETSTTSKSMWVRSFSAPTGVTVSGVRNHPLLYHLCNLHHLLNINYVALHSTSLLTLQQHYKINIIDPVLQMSRLKCWLCNSCKGTQLLSNSVCLKSLFLTTSLDYLSKYFHHRKCLVC